MATAFVTAPLIAWATRGRYYIARGPEADAAADAGGTRRQRAPTWLGCALLRDLRARLRRPRHGPLPGLPGADLLAVLHAGRALRRPVQAARQPVGAVVGRPALAAAPAHLALPGHGAGPFPAADAHHRAAAGHGVWPAVPPGAAGHGRCTGRRQRQPGATARCARASSRPTWRCCSLPASWRGGWCWRTRAARWRRRSPTARRSC
jgi:hypothetical protein